MNENNETIQEETKPQVENTNPKTYKDPDSDWEDILLEQRPAGRMFAVFLIKHIKANPDPSLELVEYALRFTDGKTITQNSFAEKDKDKAYNAYRKIVKKIEDYEKTINTFVVDIQEFIRG